MISIFPIVLAIAITLALSLIAVLVYNLRRQRESESLLSDFEDVADVFNLSIAKQEMSGISIIGYDEENNKLLFLTRTGNNHDAYLLDLRSQPGKNSHHHTVLNKNSFTNTLKT